MRKGMFAEDLSYLRHGDALGSKNPRWPYPSSLWLKQCERLLELERKLPAILSGQQQPATEAERLEYANVCRVKRLSIAGVHLYQEALARKPSLAADPRSEVGYSAAWCAARAGCGVGEGADKLTESERTR